MPCSPPKKPNQSWDEYCPDHLDCVECQGKTPELPSQDDPDELTTWVQWPPFIRLTAPGQWEELQAEEQATVEEELAAFEATLPEDPVQRNRALASFYEARRLALLRVKALDKALAASTGNPDPQIALDLANALHAAGLHEAAVQTYQYVPQLVSSPNQKSAILLGNALQNQALSLEALGRAAETETTLAMAKHFFVLAGQIRK